MFIAGLEGVQSLLRGSAWILGFGRTTSVTGHLAIQGTTVTAASFSVPMATVHSDESQRDAQFDGRIMNVSQT